MYKRSLSSCLKATKEKKKEERGKREKKEERERRRKKEERLIYGLYTKLINPQLSPHQPLPGHWLHPPASTHQRPDQHENTRECGKHEHKKQAQKNTKLTRLDCTKTCQNTVKFPHSQALKRVSTY